jgi:uncharacterized protein (TIGR00369 family)
MNDAAAQPVVVGVFAQAPARHRLLLPVLLVGTGMAAMDIAAACIRRPRTHARGKKAVSAHEDERVARVFSAPFIDALGLELVTAAAGECEAVLRLRPDHLQQNGFVHGGVLATVADHTAGAAIATSIARDEVMLTAEFKINFLRAAKGEVLRCRARVLKAGSILSVAESEVFGETDGESVMVAKALVTFAVVRRPQS